MSRIENEEWLEAAQESFSEKLEAKQFTEAAEVLFDMDHKGFSETATALWEEFRIAKGYGSPLEGVEVEMPKYTFAQKKTMLCPEVNCSRSRCDFLHD